MYGNLPNREVGLNIFTMQDLNTNMIPTNRLPPKFMKQIACNAQTMRKWRQGVT